MAILPVAAVCAAERLAGLPCGLVVSNYNSAVAQETDAQFGHGGKLCKGLLDGSRFEGTMQVELRERHWPQYS